MPFLSALPPPITAPITSLASAPMVHCAGCQWLSVGWVATAPNASLIYRIVITDGTGAKLYVSPLITAVSDAVLTDAVYLASGSPGEDGVFKIPPSGVIAYVLPVTLNPANPAPPAPLVVTWTLSGCAD